MEFIKTNVAKENTNRNSGPSITLNGGATGGATGGTASQIESHNLWGQPFDGTQDVSGTLENVENINMTGNLTTNGDININAVDENNNVSEKPVLNISVEGKNTKFSNSDKYIFSNEIDTNGVNANRLTAFNRTTTKDLTATGKSTLADLDATKAFIADLISNNITTDTLTVTEAAHFFRLIIDEIKSVGGSVILTTANAEFVKVEKINDSSTYRCYFLASQDNKKIENNFEENDMVTCRTFNVQQGVNENVNNKYYWALVTGTDYNHVTVNINNTDVECHYIDIDMSDEDADSNGVPEVGDKVAQLGNKNYSERQNAIIISAYQNIDKGVKAPSIVQYKGINDYNLATHRKTIISPDNNEFTGKLRVVSDDGTETNIKDYVDSKTDENSIKNYTEYFLRSNVNYGVSRSSGNWSAGYAPSPTKDYPYLWKYTCTEYESGNVVYTTPYIVTMYNGTSYVHLKYSTIDLTGNVWTVKDEMTHADIIAASKSFSKILSSNVTVVTPVTVGDNVIIQIHDKTYNLDAYLPARVDNVENSTYTITMTSPGYAYYDGSFSLISGYKDSLNIMWDYATDDTHWMGFNYSSEDKASSKWKDYSWSKWTGIDGKNYEWRIGKDGYWYLNGVKTEYKAVGDSADKWTIGEDGYWYLNGVKTEYKAVETPSIYQFEFSKRNFSVIIKDIGTDGNTVVYDNGKLICDLKFKIKNSITNTAETVKSSEISFDCYDDKDNKVTSLSATSINSDNEIEINNTNVQEPYYTANSPISYGILSYNHLKNSTDDANKYAEVLIPVMFATSHVFDITDERALNMYQKSTQYIDNAIKTVTGQTSSFTQDIDKIRGDVSKNTTQINTLTGEVNKKVDSSTFEQRADQIDSRVRHAEMSANKSSNLFGFSKGITFTGCVPVIQAYGIYIPAGTTQVSLTDIGLKNEGGNFIVSFDAFTDRQEGVSMQPLLDGVQSEGISVIINEKKKYEFEFFNVKNVDNGLVINLENAPNIYISNIQIEKGNVATTFLPCKEDILKGTDANMISAISTSANFVEDGTETFGSDTFTVYKTTGQSGTAGTNYDFGTASNLELKKNTIYTLSFWLKGNNQNISGYSFKSFLYPNIATTDVTFTSAADNTDTYQEIGLHIDGKTDIIPINRWVKHYIYFYSTSDVTDKSVIALRLVPKSDNTTMPELRIADIQLRQGYLSEYMGDVDSYTESYINQKADEISLGVKSDIEGKLKKTGIDIDQNNITLSGDNTIVNGNLKLRNAEDGFTIYDDSNIPRTKIIADSIGIEDNLSINLSSPYSWKQYISTSNYRSAKINGDTIVGPVTDLGNRYRPEGITFGGKNATYVGPANTKFTLSKFTTESLIAVLGTDLYVKLPSLAVYLCDKNCENQTKLFDCTLSNENRSQSYAGANNVYWIRNVQTWTSSNTGTTTSTQQYIVFKVQPIIGVTTSSANGRDWSNYTIHMPSQNNMKDVDVIVNVTITPEIANENQQTVIGYDGLYSLLGDNKYLYMNKTNITMRWGNEGFRLDDNGIHQLYTTGTSFVWGPVGKSQVKVITNMSGEADINHNVYIYAGNTDVGMVVPESMKVDGMRITVVDKAGGNGYIAFSGASVVNYDNTKTVATGGKLSGSFANPIELSGNTSWDFIYVAEINMWYMVK